MFNIGKTLLFIVAMITSAVFLFFVPHFHMPHKLASLITTHRIKSFLTLLSPIIFGAITAYIAYQQHCLAKTQADISRDQRDIAHNKLRVENYEKLYSMYDLFVKAYRDIYNFEWTIPLEFEKEIISDNIKDISDIINKNYSKELLLWSREYVDKSNEIDKLLDECWDCQLKCKFMLDKSTHDIVFKYLNNARVLYEAKKNCISMKLNGDKPNY